MEKRLLVKLHTQLLETRTQYDGIKEDLHAVLLKHYVTTPVHIPEINTGYDVQPNIDLVRRRLEFDSAQSTPDLPDKGKDDNSGELISLQNEVTLLRNENSSLRNENTTLRNTVVVLDSKVFGALARIRVYYMELVGSCKQEIGYPTWLCHLFERAIKLSYVMKEQYCFNPNPLLPTFTLPPTASYVAGASTLLPYLETSCSTATQLPPKLQRGITFLAPDVGRLKTQDRCPTDQLHDPRTPHNTSGSEQILVAPKHPQQRSQDNLTKEDNMALTRSQKCSNPSCTPGGDQHYVNGTSWLTGTGKDGRDIICNDCRRCYNYQCLGWKDELKRPWWPLLPMSTMPMVQLLHPTAIIPFPPTNVHVQAPTSYQPYHTFTVQGMKTLLPSLNVVSSSSEPLE
uniref:Uncharacterized protein n=1 Tax=Timema monikensis TaxID=170555 RepID=A0A7R9EAM8_9NEOP|nr:unnamed protein product [Timema monikensis]